MPIRYRAAAALRPRASAEAAAGRAASAVPPGEARIEENRLPERAREMGSYALARLGELQARRPAIRVVRGLGLLIGVELTSPAAAERAMYRALEMGLSFKVTMGTILTLTPPLTISREEMDDAIGIMDRALEGLSL